MQAPPEDAFLYISPIGESDLCLKSIYLYIPRAAPVRPRPTVRTRAPLRHCRWPACFAYGFYGEYNSPSCSLARHYQPTGVSKSAALLQESSWERRAYSDMLCSYMFIWSHSCQAAIKMSGYQPQPTSILLTSCESRQSCNRNLLASRCIIACYFNPSSF